MVQGRDLPPQVEVSCDGVIATVTVTGELEITTAPGPAEPGGPARRGTAAPARATVTPSHSWRSPAAWNATSAYRLASICRAAGGRDVDPGPPVACGVRGPGRGRATLLMPANRCAPRNRPDLLRRGVITCILMVDTEGRRLGRPPLAAW